MIILKYNNLHCTLNYIRFFLTVLYIVIEFFVKEVLDDTFIIFQKMNNVFCCGIVIIHDYD